MSDQREAKPVGVAAVFERLNAVKDALTVSRVFGDAYTVDNVTVIPVASVRGAGGGGGGEGTAATDAASGSGAGLGFGIVVRPVGVYTVRDGRVRWQPAIDVLRIVIAAEVVGLALVLSRRLVRRARPGVLARSA
jgi:uncharacterized spore protein YtfJ